jgi:hypothetical protein
LCNFLQPPVTWSRLITCLDLDFTNTRFYLK